jgi:hypothetical protein
LRAFRTSRHLAPEEKCSKYCNICDFNISKEDTTIIIKFVILVSKAELMRTVEFYRTADPRVIFAEREKNRAKEKMGYLKGKINGTIITSKYIWTLTKMNKFVGKWSIQCTKKSNS